MIKTPKMLSTLQAQNRCKTKYEQNKKTAIKQEKLLKDQAKTIKMIEKIYSVYQQNLQDKNLEPIKTKSNQDTSFFNFSLVKKITNQNQQLQSKIIPTKQDKEQEINKQIQIKQKCTQLQSILKNIQYVMTRSLKSKGKKMVKQHDHQQYLKQSLNIEQGMLKVEKKDHQTKKALQLTQRPLNDYNELKQKIQKQRKVFQKQLNGLHDTKNKYEVMIKMKQQEIKKLKIQVEDYKKEVEEKLKSSKSKSKEQQERRLTQQKILYYYISSIEQIIYYNLCSITAD